MTRNRNEVLDVTFASMNVQRWVKNWTVQDMETFSDHRLITFTVECNHPSVETLYRNVRRTNWDTFQMHLQDNIQAVQTSPSNIEEIESMSVCLEQAVTKAYESSCKLVTKRSSKTPPWWHAPAGN